MLNLQNSFVKLIILSLVLFNLSNIKLNAQTYNNNWIDYSQDYYKFTTNKDDIYKITFTDLLSLGHPSSLDSVSHFQLFHEGKEMAIELIDQNSNNKMDSTDYIVFYGQRNDGSLDDQMYEPAGSNRYKHYSLYTDDNAYFVTYSPNKIGKRMTTNSFSSNPNVNSCFTPDLKIYAIEDTHNNITGPVYNPRISYYDSSFFFTDYRINNYNELYTKSLPLVDRKKNSSHQIKVTVNLSGRTMIQRVINYTIGQKTGSFNCDYFDNANIDILIDSTDLVNETVNLNLISTSYRYSINFIKITYEKDLNLKSDFVKFDLASNLNGMKNVEISNPSNIATNHLYDITDINNIKKITTTTNNNLIYGSVLTKQDTITSLACVKSFAIPKKEYKRTFTTRNNNSNYLIITHPSLLSSANSYAAYRSSAAGGSFSTIVEDITSLYDEFFYGEKSPLAIREYAKYTLSSGVQKENLLLLGNATSVYKSRVDSVYMVKDLVPSFCYPASDILLTAGLSGSNNPNINAIPTGRVPALTNQEVINYLNKVKKKESSALTFNNKTVLQLIGGGQGSEHINMANLFDANASKMTNSEIKPLVYTESKDSPDYIIKSKSQSYINGGTSLVTFFGHGGYDFNDINFGYMADTATHLDNTEIFPVSAYFSCQYSNVFNTYNTISREWLLAENKGAIASIGQTTFGYFTFLSYSFDAFYSNVFNNNVENTIGQIQIKMAQEVLTNNSNDINLTFIEDQIHQTVVLGDPAVKIFGIDKGDFEIKDNDLKLESIHGGTLNSDSTANLTFNVRNYGRTKNYPNLSLNICGLNSSNQKLFSISKPFQFVSNTYSEKINIPISDTLSKIIVRIDSSNSIVESNETNNEAVLNLTSNLISTSSTLPFGVSANKINICKKNIGQVVSTFEPIINSGSVVYQWQIENGTNFVDLTNNNIYSNVNGKILKIKNETSTTNSAFVRCKIIFGGNTYYTEKVEIKFIQANNTDNLITLNNNLPTNSVIKTEAFNHINSTEKINNNSKINYKANNSIELLPGFSTTSNTNFLAEINNVFCYYPDF